jgi:DNA-binding NarL/FixJ family response regulator
MYSEAIMLIRILLVDDFEPWRRFVYSVVQKDSELQIISEVSDGLAAVHCAKELKPDVVLLDLGLPELSGIRAARRICTLVPNCKILFLSQESSVDVVREALGIGAGFVVKTDAASELLPAIKSVTLGRRFLSSRLENCCFSEAADQVISSPLD